MEVDNKNRNANMIQTSEKHDRPDILHEVTPKKSGLVSIRCVLRLRKEIRQNKDGVTVENVRRPGVCVPEILMAATKNKNEKSLNIIKRNRNREVI